jgi:serine/threonine protein kinase
VSTDPFGLVGQVLDGQFRVDELVGEGGFSAVYRGHHVGLNEPIAIKSLKLPVALQSQLVDTFVQRFRDESRLLYRLSQGNLHIVRSIAAGTTMSTAGVVVPFMVLEWMSGRSLAADFIVRRELGKTGRSVSEIVQAFATAADALSFAHAQGVVHRDLNPGNFFLASTNAGIKMKVLDFGVAKVMHDSTLGLGPRAQTVGHFRIFAPAYGAPEQFDDSIGNVGAASDVYAFALVMLEAMRDVPVNEGENLADFARMAIDPARRPSPRILGLDVSDEVEAVFVRATQLDPRQRFQTAAELWAALTSAVARSPQRGRGGAVPAAPRSDKTLPLGASFPFPRPGAPLPRPAAGAPVSVARPAPASSGAGKSTQRFAGAPPQAGGPVASGASSAHPTARPGPPPPRAASRPPSSPPQLGDTDEHEEQTKVATADPRLVALADVRANTQTTQTTQVRESELSGLPLLGSPADADDEVGEDEPTKSTELKPPMPMPMRMPASRPPVVSAADDDEEGNGPDSGGTLIMAPGQTSGQPLHASPAPAAGAPAGMAARHGSGQMNAVTAGAAGLASTMAFGPAAEAAWAATQSSPAAAPHPGPMYPPHGGAPPSGSMKTAPPPGPYPSQLYPGMAPPQGGYPPGGQMYPAPMPAGAPAGSGQISGPPSQMSGAYAAASYGADFGAAPPSVPAKKTPVAMLAVAGLLLLVGLGGIGAFLVVGRDGGKGPGASGSAAASSPASGMASESPPPPVAPAPPASAAPEVVAQVDAAAPEPAAGEGLDAAATAASASPSATTAPAAASATSPVYTWPPPATPATPTPATATPATATPAPVKDAGAPLDPNAWSESAARARLSQANGVLMACRREGGISGPGKAIVTFAPDGTVATVSLDAPYVGTKEGDCAVRQFQRAKVNAFTGAARTVTHAFDIPK